MRIPTPGIPTPTELRRAARNVRDRLVDGGLADLRRMPRTAIDDRPRRTLYRYDPLPGVRQRGAPVLLVPPLGAPDFAFDLRRGCSLVEHLLRRGRPVYLVDYGPLALADRGLGLEYWVDDVVPTAVERVAADADAAVHVLGWSLGGLFTVFAAAARSDLPVASVTALASPFDLGAVPLLAPVRPLAALTGGRVVSAVYRAVGAFPAPAVRWAFQLTSVDKYVTKPLTVLSQLADRDCLEQIEAVDHLMANMYAYPGRAFGQLYHLILRGRDLRSGSIELAGRRIQLADVAAPVLLVAGQDDVLAPRRSVQRAVRLLSGASEVRFRTAPGGHLGVLTGRRARDTTWPQLDGFLIQHDHAR